MNRWLNKVSAGRGGDTPVSVHRCVMGGELGKHRSIQVGLLIDQYLYVNITINIYTRLCNL